LTPFFPVGFVSPGIKSDPSTVQTKADIEFWGTPEFTIFKNGFLKLKAPDQVRVFPNADKCFDVSFQIRRLTLLPSDTINFR